MAHPLMLATPSYGDPEETIRQLEQSGNWHFEVKADGIRALVEIARGVARITNRSGRDITFRYPDVVGGLAGFGTDVILDGEIVSTDAAGRPDFARIHRRDAQGSARAAAQLATSLPAQLVVFDVLERAGVDLRMLTYLDRRSHLQELAPELAARGVVLPPVMQDGGLMWRVVQQLGLEGLVAKRASSRYTGRRSPDWVKIKATRRLSALVSGWAAGEGSRASAFGALWLSLLDDQGALIPVGKVGSGFDEAAMAQVWDRLTRGDHPIIVEVEYLEMSPSGHLRQPVFKGIRRDIPAEECTMRQVKGAPIG